jgi:hypothetical protein
VQPLLSSFSSPTGKTNHDSDISPVIATLDKTMLPETRETAEESIAISVEGPSFPIDPSGI